MSKRCSISNKKYLNGHRVSHSNRKTNHRQEPNLQVKRIWDPIAQKFVRIRLSTKMIKTVAKKGLVRTVRKYARKGA